MQHMEASLTIPKYPSSAMPEEQDAIGFKRPIKTGS
jgi:hypothetical protein